MYKDYTLKFFIYPSSFASNISHNNINRVYSNPRLEKSILRLDIFSAYI